MRILLLNQTFYPDVAATAQYLTDLGVELSERGHEVSVVTGRRAYDDPKVAYPARDEHCGIRIFRLRGTGFGKGAKWKRILDFGTFMACCWLKVFCLKRHDVVVALTTPPLISFLGAILCRIKGGRLIYWVMDMNPDEAVAAGWLRADGLPTRVLEWMSRFSMRTARHVVVLDRFMKARVAAKGVDEECVAVVPPWVQRGTVRYDESGREGFRKRHGLADKFVVMYSGNHSPCHPLDNLIDAARLLKDDSSTVFCFVGGGSEHRKIQKLSATEGLENVVCLPYQPLAELSASLSAADLHVVVMGNPFVGTIHPCKIYNVMMTGSAIMIIGPDDSHLTDIMKLLPDSDCHARVSHGDIDGTVGAITKFKAGGGGRNSAGYEPAIKPFDRKNVLPKLIGLIEGQDLTSGESRVNEA